MLELKELRATDNMSEGDGGVRGRFLFHVKVEKDVRVGGNS